MKTGKISLMTRSALVFACVVGLCAFAYAIDGLNLDIDFDDIPDAPASSGGAAAPAPSGGGFDIDALFGTFTDEPEPVVVETPQRELPPFTGSYRVLVSRPIYAVYEAEGRTQWISALGELFMHYKVGAFPRTHVFTMEQVNNVLPNSRDYARRFNRRNYIAAARRLGATHVLYQEYQPLRGGKRTRYSVELYWIEENATVERCAADIDHSDFEAGLQHCLAKIADAMDPGAKNTPAFNTAVWGRDSRVLEQFGGVLAGEGNFTRDNAATAYTAAERIIQRNADRGVGFHYAGALLAGRAESYAQAIQHLEAVVARSRDYPALQLRMAEYLRGAERFGEAMRAAETAAREPALRTAASMEMAMIHQGQGNLDRARSEYEGIVQSGAADGRVFFQLALLSIHMGRTAESENFLRRAAESGFALDESEYFELGRAYGNAPGEEQKAIEFLRRSMGVRQSSEEAWAAIADIHRRTGNSQQEAEAYVNMFKINMHGNSARLRMAGEIFERIGMTDKARDAYALFLDRRFTDREVSMSLARIYFNDEGNRTRNCERMRDVLRGLDTIPEAADMLRECGFRVRVIDTDQTVQARKLSPFMLTVRISGAALFAGGLATGLIVDGVVIKDLAERYSGWPGNPHGSDPHGDAMNYDNVQKMRKDLESNMMLRNAMYVLAGVGLSGFAVTFFF
jgi:Tfp pilus assembly protein PilF